MGGVRSGKNGRDDEWEGTVGFKGGILSYQLIFLRDPEFVLPVRWIVILVCVMKQKVFSRVSCVSRRRSARSKSH